MPMSSTLLKTSLPTWVLAACFSAATLSPTAVTAAPPVAKAAAPAASAAKAKEEEVVEINDRDPAMQAAFKKARASLDEFFKVVSAGDPTNDAPSLRIKVEDGGTTEYVWVHPFERDGKDFKGKANNIPSKLKKLAIGGPLRFKRDDIVDWTYFDVKARVMHGNFTTCAQLAKAPANEVAQLKKAYGLDCKR